MPACYQSLKSIVRLIMNNSIFQVTEESLKTRKYVYIYMFLDQILQKQDR